jgi:hypothetical protein
MDLNIYKERSDGAASCCDSKELDETPTAGSCCAPSSSCCGTAKEEEKKEPNVELMNRVKKMDFNEWVSKYCRLLLLINLN